MSPSSSRASMSTMPREDLIPSKAMRALYQVLMNDTLFAMFFNRINCLTLSYEFSPADFQFVHEDGMEFWIIADNKARALWDGVRTLSQLLLAAAHGIDLSGPDACVIPFLIPLARLEEVGLPMPNITLAHSYPKNPLLRHRFPSQEASHRSCLHVQSWYEKNLGWAVECLRRSIARGINSSWGFAEVLGMRKVNFLDRITDARMEAGVDEIDVLFSTLSTTDGFSYTSALDFEVAHLLRPWFTHVGIIESSTSVGMAIYPIEYALASPMDAIMSRGIMNMEMEVENRDA
ncbi:hypothetical protein K438DRAFT_2113551 [Mycena galopus ATCC 62051]|nr:hypothetical protein K438DRAFT_2113551 [Mycena galopus ATCC 62051]